MSFIEGGELGWKLVNVLGLPKHTKWLELRCAAGEIATVKCEYYPEREGLKEITTVLANYELQLKEGENVTE